MKEFDVLKFKIYPWWKDKSKKSEHFFTVCVVDTPKQMYYYGDILKKQGVPVAPGKWRAQVMLDPTQTVKNQIGYVLFNRSSIKDVTIVAHELIHVCQIYYHYVVFPLCMTMHGNRNHELFAHSHTLMFERLLKWVKRTIK